MKVVHPPVLVRYTAAAWILAIASVSRRSSPTAPPLFAAAAAGDDDGHGGATAATTRTRRRRRIGLLTAALPWTWGPYQAQMHRLSLLLSSDYGNNNGSDSDYEEIEYDVHWVALVDPLPAGTYRGYDELRPHVPNHVPPPAGFRLDHITFVGVPGRIEQPTISKINEIAGTYGLDCLVTLKDVSGVIPDADFELPVVAWVPLHSAEVRRTSEDYWVLRRYHGAAGLAPSGAAAIEDAVGEGREIEVRIPDDATENDGEAATLLKDIAGTVHVEFVPHILDREEIASLGEAGLAVLGELAVNEADAKFTGIPLVDRGQPSTLEAGRSRGLFGKDREDDFVVLLQGGNYDQMHRKGWDTAVQAYARFHDSLDDPSGVHLLMHSMESYLVPSDQNGDADAPAAVLPKGNMLHLMLFDLGLPPESYTIDIARHAPEVVMAYKLRADVCLHPSKVEGFGMNVMECQALGTPVITTNYTAMGDFTKLGRSVSPRQTIRSPGVIYDMALPDVIGIADALRELYDEHLALKRRDRAALSRRDAEVAETNGWFDETFSPARVGDSFRSLLLRAEEEFARRRAAKATLRSSSAPPSHGGYRVARGYHAPVVHWDEPYTLLAPDGLRVLAPATLHGLCWAYHVADEGGAESYVLLLPATYDDGTQIPVMGAEGGLNEDLPVLVKTFVLTALQKQSSRRKSLVGLAMQNAPNPRVLSEGLVQVERKKGSGSGNSNGRPRLHGEL